MSAIIDIIVPVFGTVAVGWVLGRTLLTAEGLRGLTQVAFYSMFPALLFLVIVTPEMTGVARIESTALRRK